MNSATLVQKLWNYCNVLRDDGMSYGDYVEQLTYLLSLKMADERSKPPHNQSSIIPKQFAGPSLLSRDGDDLFDHYRHLLEELGKQKRQGNATDDLPPRNGVHDADQTRSFRRRGLVFEVVGQLLKEYNPPPVRLPYWANAQDGARY